MQTMGARPTAWILVALSLLLVPVAVLAQPEVGALAIEQGGPRPYPPAATTFRFTGLAADNQTVLYGPVSLPAQTNTLLSDVPVTVEILKIGYFTGDDLIAGFDGYVTVRSASTTVLQNPPWVTVGACHVPVPDEDGLFGALLAEFGRTPTLLVLPPRALPFGTGTQSPVALPRRVELTNLPPVGMQGTIAHLGSPGSCISWSFAYGLGSYTAARGPDGTIRWNPSEPQNQVSSAFMYALIHALEGKQCPTGSSEGYLTGLVLDGAPSMADVPYAPDCCYINGIDVEQTFPMEARFRIGSFGSIPLPAENPNADPVKTLARLKEFLAAGHAIAFAGPVFAGFSAPAFDDGVFYPTSWCESTPAKPCGHGMLLVGYDDDIGDAQKGRGAFLVQNSFGTNWPPASSNSPAPPGRFYLSYAGFLASQLTAQVAYPLDGRPTTAAPLHASSPDAPVAHITAGHQWIGDAPSAGTRPATLIVVHRFSEPVMLESVTIAEPPPSNARATQTNGYAFSNGYTYLVRDDGYSFLPGPYAVTIVAQTSAGRVTYTGTARMPDPSWFGPSLPLAVMPYQLTDSTGTVINVER